MISQRPGPVEKGGLPDHAYLSSLKALGDEVCVCESVCERELYVCVSPETCVSALSVLA